MGINDLIRMSDIFSQDVHLLYNKDEKKSKSLWGGVISLICVILVTISASYFFIKLALRKNAIIISSINFSPYQNISNIDEFPFMIRLGGHGTQPLTNDTLIYTAWMEEWYMNEGNETQDYYKYELERCKINHIVPKYRDLFADYKDLDSFKCVNWTGKNTPRFLYGINGASKTANNHFDFNFKSCREGNDNKCLPILDLNQILGSNAFLDVRHLDFDISHTNQIPQRPIIKQERLYVSNKVFTKIFWNLRVVDYITDFGFIFEDSQTQTFFQFDSMRQTMDMRDIEASRTKAFAQFTLQPFPYKTTYNRFYEKAQSFMANVGGIIKFIFFIGYQLNYIASKRLYYSSLSNTLLKYVSNYETDNSQDTSKAKSNNFVTYNNMVSLKTSTVELAKRNLPKLNFNKSTVLKEVNLSFKHLICPFSYYKSDKNVILYRKYCKKVFELLNIKTVVGKMIEIDELKNFVFDDNQRLWFDHFTGKTKGLKTEDLQQIFNSCKDKSVKDNIDRRIIMIFRENNVLNNSNNNITKLDKKD